jgi:hypothetical protein
MTSTLPERPSAATSRENPEQADCAAQTGGELAAAPCSASPASVYIDPRWADSESQESGEPVRRELIGAKIKAIGTPVFSRTVEGVTLAIEYTPENSTALRLLVLVSDGRRIWAITDDQVNIISNLS